MIIYIADMPVVTLNRVAWVHR